jgi:phosphoribulokinase
MSAGIANILGPERVTVFCTDDYHRFNRQQRREIGISALDPACNYLDILEQHLDLLRRGHPILKPVYNHSTGDFDPPVYLKPRQFIIAEGLLGYFNPVLRRHFDVRVFLAPEEELRVLWKIKRDTTKRSYTPQEVKASLRRREGPARDFIGPQQAHADILAQFYRPPGAPQETGSHLNARLILRPSLPHPNLDELLGGSEGPPEASIHSTIIRQDDWLVENWEISVCISDPQAASVEEFIWQRLLARYPNLNHLRPEQMGSFLDGAVPRQSHPLALAQLLIAYHLLLAREELNQVIQERAR